MKGKSMSAKQENLVERIGKILDFCRNRHLLITYIELARLVGHPSWSSYLAQALGEIQKIDHANNQPLRSALVIKAGKMNTQYGEVEPGTRRPGDGFFLYARKLGYDFTSDEHFWRQQIAAMGVRLGSYISEV